MKTLQTYRLCALFTLFAVILLLSAWWLMVGKSCFQPFRESAGLAILIWLVTGSNIARWITGVSSVVLAAVGVYWMSSGDFDLSWLEAKQVLAYPLTGVAVALNSFVGWRLLSLRIDKQAQQSKKQNKAQMATPRKPFDQFWACKPAPPLL